MCVLRNAGDDGWITFGGEEMGLERERRSRGVVVGGGLREGDCWVDGRGMGLGWNGGSFLDIA